MVGAVILEMLRVGNARCYKPGSSRSGKYQVFYAWKCGNEGKCKLGNATSVMQGTISLGMREVWVAW